MASRTTKLLFIFLIACLLLIAGCSGTDTSDGGDAGGDSQPTDSGDSGSGSDSNNGGLTPPPLPEG
ncbi:hypothetical protein ACFL6I_21275 [candidate division KSB1 bacterium]